MPHYKLTYFNLRGRAEIIRYLFAFSGIKYEDHRIEQADWPKIKPSLAGQTPLEQALVDAIVDTTDDFMSMFPWGEKNQDVKQQIFNDLLTNTAPGLLRDLESFLGDKKWLVGKTVTWADFYWDVCSTTLLFLKPDLTDNYPKLLALKERVQALPAITAWIQQRPKTTL
nr:hematopoietic prostaglandin D synthase isoform X2 [Caretta caretta]